MIMTQTFHVGFLLYPNLTQLDLTGPAQFLSRAPGAKAHYIWKLVEPIPSDAGLSLMSTTTFKDCPQLDLICVPGGAGQVPLMTDNETLDFLQAQAEKAKYVTSVCTGSLVLGAAGLLQGYSSACHWMWRDYLSAFGAIPVNARVVKDRNRISGGGVTAGIDFALTVLAEVWGEDVAKQMQLGFEYNPQPPFDCGSPEGAGPERVAIAKKAMEHLLTAREIAYAEAASKLRQRKA
jgi:cyclohexyl-isocyanide hydratase